MRVDRGNTLATLGPGEFLVTIHEFFVILATKPIVRVREMMQSHTRVRSGIWAVMGSIRVDIEGETIWLEPLRDEPRGVARDESLLELHWLRGTLHFCSRLSRTASKLVCASRGS